LSELRVAGCTVIPFDQTAYRYVLLFEEAAKPLYVALQRRSECVASSVRRRRLRREWSGAVVVIVGETKVVVMVGKRFLETT